MTICFFSGWMGLEAAAQEIWDVDRCMNYAVQHNRTVRQRELEADNARLDRMKAIGSFLPGVTASTSVQYNFGRSVDPETNTYNTLSTFNNGYSMEASMPFPWWGTGERGASGKGCLADGKSCLAGS